MSTRVPINVVLHCKEDNHDKVYIASIRNKSHNKFSVFGKWGRVGRTFSSQLKGTTTSLEDAAVIRDTIVQEKLAKGYRDILSGRYNGGVTFATPCVRDNLESEEVHDDVDIAPVAGPVTKSRDKEYLVTCVDNTGIEENFDDGIEYVAEKHLDSQMVWVIDKFGQKGEFLKKRFPIVDNAAGERPLPAGDKP